jgi:hypothetical protein
MVLGFKNLRIISKLFLHNIIFRSNHFSTTTRAILGRRIIIMAAPTTTTTSPTTVWGTSKGMT